MWLCALPCKCDKAEKFKEGQLSPTPKERGGNVIAN